MTDFYLLESGTDRYLLENGSDRYLNEAATAGGIQLVQSASNRQTASTAGTVTFGAATAGNLIVALVGILSTQTDAAVSSGYTKDVGVATSTRVHIYSKVAAGGETTFQHTVGSSATFGTYVYEFSFAGRSSPALDESATGSGTTVTSMSTGTTGTTADPDEIAVAIVSCGGDITAGSPVWTSSFVAGLTQTESVTAYKVLSSTGTVTSTWGTWTTARSGASAVVTYAWAPTNVVVDVTTPGAITLAGQAVLTENVVVTSPGQVQLSGQAVLTETVVVATPGQVQLSGQAALIEKVVVTSPGQLQLSGATDIGLGGAISVSVTTPGQVSLVGQTVALRTSVSVGSGAATITGQTVGLSESVTPTAGAMTLAGATDIVLVTAGPSGTTVTVPGAVQLSGQAVLIEKVVVTTPGQLQLAGQTVALLRTVVPTSGALQLGGSTVALRFRQTADGGAVHLSGGSVFVTGEVIVLPSVETGANAAGADSSSNAVTADASSNTAGPS